MHQCWWNLVETLVRELFGILAEVVEGWMQLLQLFGLYGKLNIAAKLSDLGLLGYLQSGQLEPNAFPNFLKLRLPPYNLLFYTFLCFGFGH